MIILQRPDGGRCWVHESRVNEYLGKGFAPFPAPQAETPAKETAAPKKTRSKRNTTK